MGDPAGVGPEIGLKALGQSDKELGCQLFLLGDWSLLKGVAERCDLKMPECVLSKSAWQKTCPSHGHVLVDLEALNGQTVQPGCIQAHCGLASFRYVEEGIHAAMSGAVDAVVTGPIHKAAWNRAGISFPGHTEAFTEKMGASDTCMMLYSEEMVCTFVTLHMALEKVSCSISRERVMRVLDLTHEAMVRLRGKSPRMLVCGLNPHAGEEGLFGDQEQTVIRPAVEQAKGRGMIVEGPMAPDACFLFKHRSRIDCVVCMYHDQGHIPFKMLAFETGVNITLGLPRVRTSVDHGTAFDIAWSGRADPSSLLAAIRCAVKLSRKGQE